jgi:hypothetical protein
MPTRKDTSGQDTQRLLARGHYVERNRPGRVIAYGHSLLAGTNVDPDRDALTHLCAMLGMQEKSRAKGGAVLHWDQQGAGGDGGYATILQMETRAARFSTTLNAQATAGGTTISLTTRTGLRFGDLIMVGTGSTGGSGGELLWVQQGNQVGAGTVAVMTRTGGTLARTHASGEPAYVVPAEFLNQNPLYVYWYGLNDLAQSPISAAATANLGKAQRWTDPYELGLARLRCAEIYENDHPSCVFTGTWDGAFASTASNSGANIRRAGAVNAKVTVHTPDNLTAGSTITMGFVAIATSVDQVWTFRVDGSVVGTKTVRTGRNYTSRTNGWCYRFKNLAAGRHQLEAEVTTMGTTNTYFDWWGVESVVPPIILCPAFNRPYGYQLWPSANNRRQATLINNGAGYANGTTVFTVDTMAVAPEAGATVTFEEGHPTNSESLEVASSTTTSITTTSASTKTHADNSTVTVGMQDADITKMNTITQGIVDGFAQPDGTNYVIYVPIDDIIDKNNDYFYYDFAHFVDKGYSLITNRIYEYYMDAEAFTSRQLAYTAFPTSPAPSNTLWAQIGGGSVLTATAIQWLNQPAALTELFGRTTNRRREDLRKVEYWRLLVGVKVAGAAGSSLRMQYSLDEGTTWKYFGRSALFAEDGSIGQALLTSVSTTIPSDGGWQTIPTEAQIDNCLLRIIGIGGNAAADPEFEYIQTSWR